MRSAVMLVLVAACGRFGFDPSTGEGNGSDGDGGIDALVAPYVPTWKSGTRIKARVLRSPEGGDPMWRGWYDSQLDSACESQPSADGVERCLPDELGISGEFSDAACTQPVVVALSVLCGGIDRYTYDRDVSNNGHVFALGPIYTGQVYTTDSGPCLPTGVEPTSTVYRIGAELPPSMFVQTRYQNVTIGNYKRVLGGFEDGSEILFESLGLPGGNFCDPQTGGLGQTACRDSIPTMTPVYRDAGCTTAAFRAPAAVTESSFVVIEPLLCGRTYSRFARGAVVTQATHFVKTPGGGCTAAATGAGIMYLGTPEADPFPRGTVSIGPDRGRLGKLLWTAPEGDVFELFTFDHELEVPCRPFPATDGTLRCLPSQPRIVPAFASGTCSGSEMELAGACYGGPPMDGPYYQSCRDRGWPVRGLTSVGAAASAFVEDSCRTLPVSSTDVYDFSQRTAEIPPATFPELIETIE